MSPALSTYVLRGTELPTRDAGGENQPCTEIRHCFRTTTRIILARITENLSSEGLDLQWLGFYVYSARAAPLTLEFENRLRLGVGGWVRGPGIVVEGKQSRESKSWDES